METPWLEDKALLGAELIGALYEERLLLTWLRDDPSGWEIVSGRWSPFYITLRDVPSRPNLFKLIVRATAELLGHEVPHVDRIIGLAATGIPIAAAVGYELGLPMAYNRKLPNVRTLADLEREVAKYGDHRLVEGVFSAGDRVVLFDDVVSHFDSKEVAIRQLQYEMKGRGIEAVSIEAVVVLVDRGIEARHRADAAGVRLLSLVSLGGDGASLLRGTATEREIEVIRDYINNPEHYQDPTVRQTLRDEALQLRSAPLGT